MVLVQLAITCVNDYMVLTITVTKIYRKMNFNRWALAITAVTTTLTSRFPTNGYARVPSFIMFEARARRNGYRMFISVYILYVVTYIRVVNKDYNVVDSFLKFALCFQSPFTISEL